MQAIDGVMPRPSFRQPPIRDIGPPPSPRGPSRGLQSPRPLVYAPRPAIAPPAPRPVAPAPTATGVITLPSLPSITANNLHVRKRTIAADKTTVIVMLMTAASLVATRQPLGQVIVFLYGVFAVRRGLPSRVSFLAALGTLAMSGVLLVALGGQNGLPGVFATYTFLLLVIGVISLSRELAKDDK